MKLINQFPALSVYQLSPSLSYHRNLSHSMSKWSVQMPTLYSRSHWEGYQSTFLHAILPIWGKILPILYGCIFHLLF